MSRILKDLIEFIKEIRKLNTDFGIGWKFNHRIQAYINIGILEKDKEVEIFENVFRIDLRRKRLIVPHILIYDRDNKGNFRIRLPTEEEKEKYSDLRKIAKMLEAEE